MKFRIPFVPCVALSAALCAPLAAQSLFLPQQKLHFPVVPPSNQFGWFVIAALDADRDGDQDLAVWREQRIYVWANDGRGVFTERPTPLPAPSRGNSGALAVGDFDADGDLDLYQTGGTQAIGLLLQNDGAGNFSDVTSARFPTSPSDARDAQALDADGDGDLDLVILAPSARLFRNDGQGAFAELGSAFPPLAYLGGRMVTADFDGNGRSDVLVTGAVSSAGRVSWLFFGSANGTFSDASSALPPTTSYHPFMLAGDADSDGDPDVLATHGGQLEFWRNANGTLSRAALPALPSLSAPLALFDMDGDGDRDVLVGGYQVLALENLGAGVFSVRRTYTTNGVENAFYGITADFDANGHPDCVASGVASPGLRNSIWFHYGSFEFADGAAPRVEQTVLRALVTPVLDFTDADGDGDLDALTQVTDAGETLKLFVNDGRGGFSDQSALRFPPAPHESAAATIVEVTGDGRPDLVALSDTRADLVIRPGDAQGRFLGTPKLFTLPIPSTFAAVAFADVDGDRDLDCIAHVNVLARVALLLNDGAGNFTDASAGRIPAGVTPLGVAVEDVDGDRDEDILTARVLLLNDGTGTFVRKDLPIQSVWSSVASGDVDGDGDRDLALFSTTQGGRVLLLRDGLGNYTPATGRFPGAIAGVRKAKLADVDGDGDLDIVQGLIGSSSVPEPIEVLLNDGAGFFAKTPLGFPAVATGFDTAIALGDVDGDGDVDLGFASRPPTFQVATGLVRGLAVPFLPRVGGTFTMDLSAKPGRAAGFQFVLPLFAAAEQRTDLGAFGVCFLDPASLVTLQPLYVPKPGSTLRTVLPVPNDPALRGVAIHAQGFVVDPLGESRFTNAVREVLR